MNDVHVINKSFNWFDFRTQKQNLGKMDILNCSVNSVYSQIEACVIAPYRAPQKPINAAQAVAYVSGMYDFTLISIW